MPGERGPGREKEKPGGGPGNQGSASPFDGLPPGIIRKIETYIEKKTGKGWTDPVVLERLSRAIVAQKSTYWRERKGEISYRKGYHVLGYLAYHFPVYYVQALHLMADLERRGLLFSPMRILDVGTGPGTVPLAIADYLSRTGERSAEVFSIERSAEFVEAYRFLSGGFSRPGEPVILHPPLEADIRTLESEDLPPSLDLIIFQNVLNELPTPSPEGKGALVRKYAGALSGRGSVLLVEPADRDNALALRRVAASAAGEGLFIHSPCHFLWGTPCTSERCWSFVEADPILPPPFMQALAGKKEGYRFLNVDIKYSYALLRRIPPEKVPGTPLSARRNVRLSSLSRHVNRRIRTAATIASGDLGDSKTHVFFLCDGTGGVPAYAVLPSYHRTSENEWLLSAPYGSVAEFSGVLVRFNRRYQAYNLLVTRASTVTPLGAAPGRREE